MTFFDRRPAMRWLAPLLVALLLTAGVSGVGALTANAGDKLAPRSASQLLVDVQKAKVHGLSGTIVQNADLGLPSLPGLGSTGSSDMSSLVSGSHTLRLWYAGPNKVRVSLLGTLGESDLIRNGGDLWTWSSKDKTATHRTVPVSSKESAPSIGAAVSPQQAADEALKAIDPSTKVSTIGTSTVAGRSAYELLLEPRDSASLVDSVRVAIDGKTHVPTRVQVFAKNSAKPSFEVAFTSFDPTTPSSSVFSFNPPPGTKVTQETSHSKDAPALKSHAASGSLSIRKHLAQADSERPKVVGSGWTSVIVLRAPQGTDAKSAGPGSMAGILGSLPKVNGSWGSGHLLRGTLFSALLTDDGRVAVGAVAPDALYAALGR